MLENVARSPFEVPHRHGNDYATWYIRRKSDELVGHFGITEGDHEDIKQSLTLDLILRWPKFSSDQSKSTTFIALVVRNRVSTIIRHRRTEQQLFEEIGHVPIDETIENEVANCCRIGPKRIDQEYVALAADIKTVLAKLPSDLRDICEWLKKRESISELSRQLGMPVSTLRHRMKKIRAHFEDAALHDYL